MIKVNSNVKINQTLINKITQASVKALAQTGEYVHAEVVQAQVVPHDTGNLQNESFFVDASKASSGMVSLVHSTPYARRLYYHPEYNFHQDVWTDEKGVEHEGNPNAKGRWLEDWADAPEGTGKYSADIRAVFARLYRRLAEL